MKSFLKEASKELNIELTDKMLGLFERYYELLMSWNEKINLTAITQKEDVAIKHFLDSLTASGYVPAGARVADVGTGAGFPGLPLKIYRDDINLTLIDSLNKRIEFLKSVCGALSLNDVLCCHLRAEDAGVGALRESFDIVCSRAVARLNVLCEYCLPLVKKGGLFVAYKAKDDGEASEAKKAIRLLGGEVEKVEEFKLFEMNRLLIIIRKKDKTPEKYPRSAGKIKSSPL